MNTRTVRLLAVTTIAGLGLGAAVVPAGASPAKPVNIYTKAKCNQAINERLFDIRHIAAEREERQKSAAAGRPQHTP